MTKTYEISYDRKEEDTKEFREKARVMQEKGFPIWNLKSLRSHEIKSLLEQEGYNLEDILGYVARTPRELQRAKKGKHPFNWLEARRYRAEQKNNLGYLTSERLLKEAAKENKEIDAYKRPLVASELEHAVNHALPRSEGIVVYQKDSFDKSIERGGGSIGNCTLYNLKKSAKPVVVIEIKRA